MSSANRVYAIFPDRAAADRALSELHARGVPDEACSVLGTREELIAQDQSHLPLRETDSAGHGLWQGVLVGGATGAVVVSLLAGPLGLFGIGPVAAAAFGAVGGGIYGAIANLLWGANVPRRRLRDLVEQLEGGQVLVSVDARGLALDPERITRVLTEHGGRCDAHEGEAKRRPFFRPHPQHS